MLRSLDLESARRPSRRLYAPGCLEEVFSETGLPVPIILGNSGFSEIALHHRFTSVEERLLEHHYEHATHDYEQYVQPESPCPC